MGYRSFVNERRRLGILAVEAAKGLGGADLAARKSHGLKGPLIAELGLQVWLPGRTLRVLFFSIFFGHKSRPKRLCRAPQQSSTEYHQSAADDVATQDDTNKEVPGRSTQGTEERWIYEVYRIN